jgi:hypothetical protein
MVDDTAHLPWIRLGLTEADWRAPAHAFYDLAHDDFGKFIALPGRLKTHPVGELCAGYIESGDRQLVERAGKELTGSNEWYVYLGRS